MSHFRIIYGFTLQLYFRGILFEVLQYGDSYLLVDGLVWVVCIIGGYF